MIKGVGTDIIEIARILSAIERRGKPFLDKLFTKDEQTYCDRYSEEKRRAAAYAGRFAAKEAIVKALGTGFGAKVSWHDIALSNDENGKPIATFSQKLKATFPDIAMEISISHCQSFATAIAIAY